ncbi:hypothetical protein V6N13_133068 [Hibiscus sabdariffa]
MTLRALVASHAQGSSNHGRGELRSRAWRVKSAHVRRGENKIVDSMAKLTSFDGCNTMQFSSPLVTDSSIMSFVIADAGD